MLTIDLMLKNSPLPISVQKKEQEEAQALYQKILGAMGAATSEVIELHCDKEVGKTVAVLSDQISAVIMSDKAGATTTGRSAGFFAAIEK